MTIAETAQLAVQLDLKGNLQQGLSGASRSLSSLETQVGKTASKIGRDLGGGISAAAHNIERLALAGAGLAIGGGAAAVKWAGDFQAGMNTINTVAMTTPVVLKQAGEGLRTIFRATGQSMEDLQNAEYDLVSAGIKLKDAQGGVNVAVKLSIGALGTTAEAVDVLTTAINSYNLKAKDGTVATATFTRISDELAQAVADGKVKLSEIAATYAQVAPVAAQAGVKTGEIAAALGYLTAKGVPAAEVMTQMARAIIELEKPGPALVKVLKSLGTTGEALIKKDGLAGALEVLRERAAKLKIPFIDLFGRVEAYKFALQTTGPDQKGFADELVRIGNSAGETSRQFDERAQGFNYQLGVLKANVKDAGITIGMALLPKLTLLSKQASDFLRGHQGDLKAFADNLARGFQEAVHWADQLDWEGIAQSVKSIAGFGKSLAQGFLSLPPEAKEILLGLFAANKFTGGAVMKIAVDLGGGVAGGLGTLIARGFGSALSGAGIGKLFVQPVFVTNPGFGLGGGGIPGAGGATGLLGNALKLLPWVAFGALIAEGFIEGNKAHPEAYGTGVAPGSPAPKPFTYGPRSALVDPGNMRYQGPAMVHELQHVNRALDADRLDNARAQRTLDRIAEKRETNRINIVNHLSWSVSVADINGKLKIRQTYKSGYNYIS